MTRSCLNCKYYDYNRTVLDEKGKHECYARWLIHTPYNLVDSVEGKNECKLYEPSDGEDKERLRRNWMNCWR